MASSLEDIENEALKLPTAERARLVEHLLASLDNDNEIEEAWALEVERRIKRVDSGHDQLIPLEEAIARAEAALR